MTSATDDPLIHLRLTGLERYAIKILESDESKWQGPEILAVIVTITDGAAGGLANRAVEE